jgi:hypothetical protein
MYITLMVHGKLFAFKVNLPSISVDAPMEVPLIFTTAPKRNSLVVLSCTVPIIV